MLRLLILFYEVLGLKCPSLACTGFILAFLQVRWRLYAFAARIWDNRGAFCLGTQVADEMDWSAFSHFPKWTSLLPLVVQVYKGTWVDCQPLLRSLILPNIPTFQTLSTFFLKRLWLLVSSRKSCKLNLPCILAPPHQTTWFFLETCCWVATPSKSLGPQEFWISLF